MIDATYTEQNEELQLTSSRQRIDSRISLPQSQGMKHFKQEIEHNYCKSVANQIYSFPLQQQFCSSLISSENSSLELIQEYNLNYQNNKQNQSKRITMKSKKDQNNISIENERENKKHHIRNQSSLSKKKYKDLIKLHDTTISPKKRKSHNPKKYQKTSKNQYQEQKEKHKKLEQKFEITRAKSSRLKTQADESFSGLIRKAIKHSKLEKIKSSLNQ